tara:strand:- start:17351 stop:18262 length:912 start_codon:yes stop_codon:yes gene_type:complete
MEKALVIGGRGFLGSHVSDVLIEEGYAVSIFDNKISPHISNGQKMILGDISDRNAIRKAIKGIDYVFHFAAIADINEARDNPELTAQLNIMGTIYILEACKEYNIKRFIYASSIYVYTAHGSFYRSSKQACELFIENYQEEYGLDYTVLRYGSLYGKRANHFNFIHNSVKQALTEGKIVRKGNGEEIRDYINIIDAAKATVKSLEETYKNSYLMITGSQSMKVKELLNTIKEIMNNQIEIKYTDGQMAGHYKMTPYSFKPKVALKLSPESSYDLGQGLLETIYSVYEDLVDKGEKTISFEKNE